jgi:chromosomal replication initiator protein
LVVALEPLGPPGRLAFLVDAARRRQLAVQNDILTWLAKHLTGGGRPLEGAVNQLAALAQLQRGPLDLQTVAAHFQTQADAGRPTVERIAQQVERYFRLEDGLLLSRRRYRHVVLPRQVGMYLTRRLTGLSLGQIGAYFGGRDHSTVLHACRKVERSMARDAILGGAVRQIYADLV